MQLDTFLESLRESDHVLQLLGLNSPDQTPSSHAPALLKTILKNLCIDTVRNEPKLVLYSFFVSTTKEGRVQQLLKRENSTAPSSTLERGSATPSRLADLLSLTHRHFLAFCLTAEPTSLDVRYSNLRIMHCIRNIALP